MTACCASVGKSHTLHGSSHIQTCPSNFSCQQQTTQSDAVAAALTRQINILLPSHRAMWKFTQRLLSWTDGGRRLLLSLPLLLLLPPLQTDKSSSSCLRIYGNAERDSTAAALDRCRGGRGAIAASTATIATKQCKLTLPSNGAMRKPLGC